MKTTLKLLGAAAVTAMSFNANAVLVIDSFTTPQGNTPATAIYDSVSDFTAVSNEVAAAEALGGYRELIIDKTGGDPDTNATIKVAAGKLQYGNEPGVTSVGTVRWDGGLGASSLGGLDLTSYGNTFIVNVTFLDLASGFDITLKAYTGAAVSSYTFHGDAIGQYGVNFSNLLGAADLTSITALEMVITGSAGLDLSVDSADIPEPASLALVGLSLLGLGALRRRQA
ncbi:PEP-CTERM sorting domain-containing protein [Viridibacterium curvum]|uniref:Ice-binding protein C-terminal domain-containing protein n=1 Tax=Viridibacterium curvum TaxID=1101404 RepID=A0ABP9QEM6_9RHOO